MKFSLLFCGLLLAVSGHAELKPAGTVESNQCGQNTSESSQITEVCDSSVTGDQTQYVEVKTGDATTSSMYVVNSVTAAAQSHGPVPNAVVTYQVKLVFAGKSVKDGNGRAHFQKLTFMSQPLPQTVFIQVPKVVSSGASPLMAKWLNFRGSISEESVLVTTFQSYAHTL